MKGYALSTQKKLMPYIIAKHPVKHKVTTNKNDDMIIWDVEGQTRHVMKISKNVNMFDVAMAKILKSKTVRKAAKLKPEELVELDEMLKHQTSIKVIKTF